MFRRRDSEAFDAFYQDARGRLLLQTYALTGDLAASRAAVRDAFVVAWKHWRKVSRLADPEASVRSHVWTHVRRGRTDLSRPQDTSPDPGPTAALAATLDALDELALVQRKVLLLSVLSDRSLPEIARELGVPRDHAERQLQAATSLFAERRAVPEASTAFEPLRAHVEHTRWPRATILRRAGAARRGALATVGVGTAVAALVVGGVVVTQGDDLRARLASPAAPRVAASVAPLELPSQRAALVADDLLTADQVTRLARGRDWHAGRTTDNSSGDGLALPCRQSRYADPEGGQVLLRRFSTAAEKGTPAHSAVQVTELSDTERAARTTYETAVDWYAGCADPRTQLLSTHRVGRVGDGAVLFVLRSWRPPASTLVVGVARTGRVTTTTLSRAPRSSRARTTATTAMLAAATNALCGAPGAGSCAGPPRLSRISPYPVGEAIGMLDEVDLPPVTGVERAWVGTRASRAPVNYAASGCARADLSPGTVSRPRARSFVIPRAALPAEFGITETVGTMPSRAAATWMARVRGQVEVCAGRGLGTTAHLVARRARPERELLVWQVTTEISDGRSLRYLTAVLRNRSAVAQLGFIPAEGASMAPGAFSALAQRALVRLGEMPGPDAGNGRGPGGR